MEQQLTFPIDYGWLIRTKDLKLNIEEINAKVGLTSISSNFIDAKITVDEFYRIFEAIQNYFPNKAYALELEKVWTVESFS
jgi:hypothetical protein